MKVDARAVLERRWADQRALVSRAERFAGPAPGPAASARPDRHRVDRARSVAGRWVVDPATAARRRAAGDDHGRAWSGWVMAVTVSPSIPSKSLGLQVYKGSLLARAVAAMRASNARAAGLRPARRIESATAP